MRHEYRAGIVCCSALLTFLMIGLLSARPNNAEAQETISGTWACQSISGGAYTGRPCRLEPWLKLEEGTSYVWGRESGKWTFEHKVLTLSKRKGKGHLDADGKLIYEYEMSGKQYVMTLYRRRQ